VAVGYELEHIELKISANIVSAASENIEFDVPHFLQDLDDECSKVKRAFRHQVVSFENERLVKRYFHFHQESLIDLINTLHAEQHGSASILQSVLDRLAGLLRYLEEHFPEYFNQDMKMPVIYFDVIKAELDDFGVLLSRKFITTKTDTALIQVLKNSFSGFDSPKGSFTFRQYYYLKLLKINIESLDTSGESSFSTIDLLRLLMHCNFNTESFSSYILKFMASTVDQAATIEEKLGQLTYYLKLSNQEMSNQAIAFNYARTAISVQVADWLSQELMYLKTKQQLMSTANAEDIVPTEFKLNFDLSVPHIAYLFRAFTETGVIQNKNVSELIRFLTKYVRTKRSESISYESFRIKYYSTESGTKDAVKKALQTVLNFINKN
jgi:hypothetical protein